MKDIAKKMAACFLAATLSLGLCPAAGLAAATSTEQTGAAVGASGTFTSTGATSVGSTEVGVLYDKDVHTKAFSTAGQIADATSPIYKDEADALEALWVRTKNGSGTDSAYQQQWKRIDKTIPAGASGADVSVADSEWAAAQPMADAQTSVSTPADNPNGFQEFKQFNLKVSAGSFVDGHVYFYQASVTNGGKTVVFDPIKVVYVDKYTGGTIEEKPAGAWKLDGHAYDNTAGLAAMAPQGSLLKGSWLEVLAVTSGDPAGAYAAIAKAVADANAAAVPDASGVGEVQMLKGVSSMQIDVEGNAANDPLYTGDVLVTYTVPTDLRAADGEEYAFWWSNGGTVVSVPTDGWAPTGAASGSPQVGYMKVTRGTGGQPDTITFLVKGTSASVGAFGLAIKAKVQLKRFTIDAQVDTASADLGTITPAGKSTFTAGDGIEHAYLLNAYLGYQVKDLSIAFQRNGATVVESIPKAGDPDKTVQVNGQQVGLGHWQGNQYVLPAAWSVDATLTVSFEAVPDAAPDPSHPDAKVKATLATDGNGKVLLDNAEWTSGSTEEFPLNEWAMLTLQGNNSGAVYVPQSVTVTYANDAGAQMSETYLVSGTTFAWKMTRDVSLRVSFALAGSSDIKQKHTVAATWEGSGGWASFDGAEATSGVSKQISEGASATLYITARVGWQLAFAHMGTVDLTAFAKEQTTAADGTRTYILTLPSVTEDTAVTLSFSRGAIVLKVPTSVDGGTIAPAGDQTVEPGGSVQLTITPAAGKDLSGITLGGVAVTPLPQPVYDANGNPTYTLTITYDQLTATDGAPVLGVTFVDVAVDPTEPDDDTEYKVTATVEGEGTVQLSATTVKAGGSVDVQMIPATATDGQRAWKVAGVRVTTHVGGVASTTEYEWAAPVYTIRGIASNVEVVAIFKQVAEDEKPPVVDTWKMSMQVSAGGTVTPAGQDGVVSVVKGYWQEFTFTPDEGYKVGDVVLVEFVDGAERRTIVASGNASAVVTPVGDCTLEVTFQKMNPTLVDPDTGQEKPGNGTAQVTTAVEVQFGSAGAADVPDWRDYVTVEPVQQPVKLGDDATFMLRLKPKAGATDLHSSDSYEYLFKGVLPDFEGASGVVCEPIYQGKLTGLNLQYTPGRATALGGQLSHSVDLLAGGETNGLSAQDPFEAYQITVSQVTGNVKIKLVLQSTADYKKEHGITGSFPMLDAGQLQTLYLQQSGPGMIGAYGMQDGALEMLSSMQLAEGAVKRIAVVPNRGAHVASAMLYTGVGASPDALTGAGIRATDVTAMARTGRVSVQMGGTPVVLVVVFVKNGGGQDNTAQVTFDNPKARPADTVVVGNETYDVYTAELTLSDGSKGTARFYMTPKDGAFAAGSKPVFTFHVLEGTTGFSADKIYVVDQLTVNGVTSVVSPPSSFVQLALSAVTHFSVTLREAGPDEGVIQPTDRVLMTVVQGDTYQIRPSTGYMSKSDPTPFAITAVEGANKKVKNVVDTVLIDGKALYSPDGCDTTVFEALKDGAGMRFKIKATGEVVVLTLSGTSVTVSFESLAGSHSIAAGTFRAVDVQVQSAIEGGVIVPNGDIWWPVDESATPTDAIADGDHVLKEMQLFVAPKDGYDLQAFTVNGQDRTQHLVADDAADDGFDAARQEAANGVQSTPAQVQVDGGSYGKASRYSLSDGDLATVDTAADRIAVQVGGAFAKAGTTDTAVHTVKVRVEGGHGKVTTAAGALADAAEFTLKASDRQVIAFKPDAGYRVSVLTDNGQDVLSKLVDNTYVLENVGEDRTIIVRFAPQQGTATGINRALNRLQSLATTGDLGGPALLALAGVACAAAGVALLCANRHRRRKVEISS